MCIRDRPYGIEVLIRLYMEIISELFLLPAAVALKADGSYYRPVYAKGVHIKEFEGFRLETEPFKRNWNLKTYPSFLSDLTEEQLGQFNYAALTQWSSYLLAPVSYGDQDYLIICVSCESSRFDDAAVSYTHLFVFLRMMPETITAKSPRK